MTKPTYSFSELSTASDEQLMESYDLLSKNVQDPSLILMELHQRRQSRMTVEIRDMTKVIKRLSWAMVTLAFFSTVAVILSLLS